jgi:hypothetical protein
VWKACCYLTKFIQENKTRSIKVMGGVDWAWFVQKFFRWNNFVIFQ